MLHRRDEQLPRRNSFVSVEQIDSSIMNELNGGDVDRPSLVKRVDQALPWSIGKNTMTSGQGRDPGDFQPVSSAHVTLFVMLRFLHDSWVRRRVIRTG